MDFQEKRQLALDILRAIFPEHGLVFVIHTSIDDDCGDLHVGSTMTRESTEFCFRQLLSEDSDEQLQ